jgi:L-2,4-diaminobutyrate decarboxylase
MDSDRLRELVDTALDALELGGKRRNGGPAPAVDPGALAAKVRNALAGALPETGAGDTEALASLTELLAAGSVDPAHPLAAAHLHCPPLPVAVAADLVAGVLNQSLDSWDQGPAAIAIEREVIRALAALAGLNPDRAGGVITTGGTESNLMGLLLAREAGHTRTFCSEHAHFSIQRAARTLGLGLGERGGVTVVRADADHRMDPAALAAGLAEVETGAATVVATAGTTGTGAVDPLPAIADLAAQHRAWLHVDAAYGGGALFSARLAPLLAGLTKADSIALDLHKIGWQPVPAGVFLAADDRHFAPLVLNAGYLNPIDDEAAGYDSLLGRSLRTTRRADAFKIAVTLRAVGRTGLGDRLDRCHDLAGYAARVISAQPRLMLAAHPVLTTVVFRYATTAAADLDRINAALRRRLLREGRAVVGRTELDGAVRLKLTLLNPDATERDIDALIAAVVVAGDAEVSAAEAAVPS